MGALADNAGGYSSYSLMPPRYTVLTVEYKLNLLSPAHGDKLIAKGQVLKAGRNLFVTRSEVFIENQQNKKLCATSLQTVMAIADKQDHPGMQPSSH